MEQQGRILDGDLETLGLQSTLKMLSLSDKTGILSVVSGQERMKIALQSGHIIGLEEPNAPAPDLIEVFRLLGRIQRGDAGRLRQMAGQNPNTAMALLVQWGILTPQEMQQRIEFGIIQAVSRAVRWERGRFEFHRDISSIDARLGLQKPLNVDHVLLEAIRMADERAHYGTGALTRQTVARWMPQFDGDVAKLGLAPEEVGVLCLSNGQLPLSTIAYGMLLPETRVSQTMRRLLDLGLIEVVDARLESDLERSLVNLLTQAQHQLSHGARTTPESRMLTLARTMGTCIGGLLAHHGMYARALRGRGEVPPVEVKRYLNATFRPLLQRLQREFPRMEDIIRFEDGRLDIRDVETLDRVVRGQELLDCYWDAVRLLFGLMRQVFDVVLADEAGQSRVGRQFEDLWSAFLRELDEEMRRLASKHAATRV